MKLTYALARDSGGPGMWRGGLGSIVRWGFDTDAILSFQAQRTIEPVPAGPDGGSAPGGRNDLQIGTGASGGPAFSLAVDVPIHKGQILTLHGAGGAGYGSPRDRDPLLVLGDVRDGFVSISAAAHDYGVVIHPETLDIDIDIDIDVDATRSLRVRGNSA